MKKTMLFTILVAMVPMSTAYATSIDKSTPMTVVVPYSSGSVLDTAMRIVADEYNNKFKEVIIIENKPGGGGAIAAQKVARANPDGKTVLMGSSGMLSINPHTHTELSYSPEKDFKPITGFVAAPMLMAVNKDVPVKNVAEFVEWAKKNPDRANYGSFSTGNPSHFAGFILNKATGAQLENIPYTGGTRYIQDLVGGQLTSLFAQWLNLRSFYQDGRLKVIATSAPQRSPEMPEVATFKEQGLPELTFMMWTALIVPSNTPDNTVSALSERFKEAMTSPEVVKRLNDIDFQPMPLSPAETRKFVQNESERWKDVVQQTGFKVN